MAMLSILALYNWDNTIFNDLNVPQGMDKNNIIDNILFECAELSLLYTDPAFMKRAIKQWSDKEQNVWTKLYATENFEYNPIWNVDADIVETGTSGRNRTTTENNSLVIDGTDARSISETGRITESGSSSEQTSGTSSEQTSGTSSEQTSGTSSGTTSETVTDSVTGYNSTSWQDHTKRVSSGTSSGNTSGTSSGNTSGTSSGNTSGTDLITSSNQTDTTKSVTDNLNRDQTNTEVKSGTEAETGTNALTTRRTGNIGVTTTQQMIREERDVALFNTIEFITNSFKKRFCIMVY